MPKSPRGRATLRLAFAGSETRSLTVSTNGGQIGNIDDLTDTGVIRRDADRGYWQERDVAFDASLLKAGTNVLKLTVPAGGVTAGIQYDYLRLELDENSKP